MKKIKIKKIQITVICCAILFFITIFNPLVSAKMIINTNQTKIIAKWTYMSYASFDTPIANSLVCKDVQHLIDVMRNISSNEELNLVMLLDVMFPEDKTNFIYFNNSDIENQSWFEIDSNMGDKDTLIEFIKQVKEKYPAEKYALILKSPRGMSWQGLCKDDDINKLSFQSDLEEQTINMPELSGALREVTNNGRDKIDLIGFSTCITGSLEVAYQISPFAEYMVASEENMQSFTSNSEYSWPFNKSLQALKNNPNMSGEEFAECIVNNFKAGKNTSAYIRCTPFKKKVNIPIDTTLSAINLSKISNVVDSVDNLASLLIDNIQDYRAIIKKSRSEARRFGPWYPRTRFGYALYLPICINTMEKLGIPFYMDVWLDLYHFTEILSSKITNDDPEHDKVIAACHEVMKMLNESVIANNVSEGDNAHGLHIYFPPDADKYNVHLWWIWRGLKRGYACYEKVDLAHSTYWNEMIYKVYRIPDSLVNIWLKRKIPLL